VSGAEWKTAAVKSCKIKFSIIRIQESTSQFFLFIKENPMAQSDGIAASSAINPVQYEAAGLIKVWRQNTTCMLRANERLLRGFMDVAKRQSELGQELLHHRLSALQSVPDMEGPAGVANFAKAQVDHSLQGIERMRILMGEITNEVTRSVNEATRLLMEDAASLPPESAEVTTQPAALLTQKAERGADRRTK
jgi:hypothetical protein